MFIMKSRGPKIDPCGTPYLEDFEVEFFVECHVLGPDFEVRFHPGKCLASDSIMLQLPYKYGMVNQVESFAIVQK